MKSYKNWKSKPMHKINILFISSQYNYFKNISSSFPRMYNNLRYFYNNKDFNLFVLQPDDEKKLEIKHLKINRPIFYYKNISIFGRKLFLFLDFNPFFLLKALKIIRKYKIDIIHVDYLFGICILKLFTKIPISYNSYNVEYNFANTIGKFYFKIPKIFQNLYSKYIKTLEFYAVKKVDNINAISITDRNEFIKLYNIPPEKIIVTFVGYDKHIFECPIKKAQARQFLNVDNEKFIIIYHGSYLSKSDSEAIDIIKNRIAPSIKDKEILFLIAGKNLPHFKNTENLKFVGFVEDIRTLLYSADIAIVPILRGSGIRIKILDYISACIPLISTKKGAEGHYLEDGVHSYIVKNSINEFLSKIYELKHNPEKIKEFQLNIKKLLLKKYDWNINSKLMENRYKKIIMNRNLNKNKDKK